MVARSRTLRTSAITAAVLAIALTALPLSLSAGVQYSVTDLGVNGVTYYTFTPGHINNFGEVVGDDHTRLPSGTDKCTPYVYSNGAVTYLATSGICHARDINDLGQVVYYSDPPGTRSYLYDHGQVTDLGPHKALCINDLGQIGGSYYFYSGGSWSSQPLYAQQINNAGQMIGWFAGADSLTHGCLYSGGVLTDFGSNVTLTGINEAGNIAGYTSEGHAILYRGGEMIDLGTLPGGYTKALGLNSRNQVVGYSTLASGDVPFIYSDGVMTDLNSLIDPSSGWKLDGAMDINDQGQILVQGWRPGQDATLLLTPVPEPATLSFLAVGLSTLFLRRRRMA